MGRMSDKPLHGYRLTPDGQGRYILDLDLSGDTLPNAPLPDQASLDVVLARADLAVLRTGGAAGGKPLGGDELLRFEGERLDELRKRLRINAPERPFHCLCFGDYAIELHRDGVLYTAIGLHHGESIRTCFWSSDASLTDGAAMLEWLAEQGAKRPLDDVQRARAHRADEKPARQRFEEACPAELGALRAKILSHWRIDAQVAEEAIATLRAAVADDEAVALLLLRWYGAPGGPWTGFPASEMIPEELLHRLPIERVAGAVGRSDLEPWTIEGAARYFADWNLSRRYPKAVALLPSPIIERLRVHVVAGGERDKIARWTNAERRAGIAQPFDDTDA
jgi:hypothetical protein